MPPNWRKYEAVIGLGITQIMGYGTLYYAFSVLLPEIAGDLGLTLSGAFGVFSMALLLGGLVSPLAGMAVDRFGGRWLMTVGSMAAGLALIAMGFVQDRIGLN